ncbi:MAG: glycosyltransferase family 39 protein [Anaerolineae bacterium]
MTTITPNIMPALQADKNWLESKWMSRISVASLLVIGIMLLAAVLNFANLDAIADGNLYYTAAVKSMLQSFSNFFFVAAEPGGSVTIDKPPLGLWLQAISAMVFGVNGFAVSLPQILAGIFSVPVLYHLVKRYFGTVAGLIAAFVLAVTPVSIAAQRNNTMDATLIFTLLLAAWAFIKATDTGRLRWLLLGGVLVGLGFNIKMLQAFLPLPAFYALYFFGAKVSWRRKIAQLFATSVVLLGVSLSWVMIVDLTPADQRPYVGSSDTNSALELAIGYNGLQRLLGGVVGGGGTSADDGTANNDGQTPPAGANGQFTPPTGTNGQPPTGANGQPPALRDGNNPVTGAGGGIGGNEIGSQGILRLFSLPLANEVSWLLPFGLFSVVLLAVAAKPRLPLSKEHQALVLWGGWLLTEVVFFSAASFFHAYYLAMLAPPLAALVGIGVMQLWKMRQQHSTVSGILLIVSGAASFAFQMWVASQYTTVSVVWMAAGAAMLVAGAVLVLQRVIVSHKAAIAGFACVVIAMTAVPAVWAGLTTFDDAGSTNLPHAFAGGSATGTGAVGLRGDNMDEDLLAYLDANTQDTYYMMAVASANQGDTYVMASGRPVFFIGGFNGGDPVIDAEGLQALVDAGELRYVLWGGNGGPGGGSSSDISTWLQSSCTVVSEVSTQNGTLYQCGS